MAQEFFEFLKEHYFIPFYFVTWVIAVFSYRKYFDTVLKYLPVLIAYTFFTELLGYFIKYHENFQFFSDERYNWHNVIIYNIYQVVVFSFFYWVYWKTVVTAKHKTWIKYGAIITFVAYLVSLFFQDPFHTNLYYADLVGSLVLLFAIYIYAKEKRADKSAYPLRQNLLFWISLGLAIFYLFFPFIFLIGYLKYEIWAQYNLQTILVILIVLMYALFSIGFILGKRRAFR
ncbi:hypothetical protein [Flagellimonas allohymeniacidonis]|uniref:Uncharacterized protein n=1 Tax=Flagellimonas allohymeniacidonis TaxID=2517819 RepID=A0A4Q8QG56_9FLAO|nr:hypothetical protein [Allomuricauda hymeniacidonis]TAI49515.1 hypothetical protein EW142_06855 [Allomuricauda hymeniacidonis]